MDTSPDEETSTNKKPRAKRKSKAEGKFGNLTLSRIQPKTHNQQLAFDHYESGSNLMLLGSAGTGKTFISMYLGLRSVMSGEASRIVVVRSAVPTRDIGFMPGSVKEKLAAYEEPYKSISTELFGNSNAYSSMKHAGAIEFIPTSFIRGTTIENSVIVVDECSNLTGHELDSIMTRVGEGSRIIFSGDYSQTDFFRRSDREGLRVFTKVLSSMDSFEIVEFTSDDIVRSGLVKEYIMTKNRMGADL